jgi:DNA-binding PadR family transcriptional regulator
MSPRKYTPLTIEYILLGLLNQNPSHGYLLNKELDRFKGVGLVWNIKQGKLYALLDRLEEEGLIQSRLLSTHEYPPRKEFSLTPLGIKVYHQWMQTPVEHGREMRQFFLARLYFAKLTGAETARELLIGQISKCDGWLHDLQQAHDSLDASQTYEKSVYEFRISQTGAMHEWLKTCLSEQN